MGGRRLVNGFDHMEADKVHIWKISQHWEFFQLEVILVELFSEMTGLRYVFINKAGILYHKVGDRNR